MSKVSILTNMKRKVNTVLINHVANLLVLLTIIMVTSCSGLKEDIEFKGIKNVVVDGTTEPRLKAEAFFYNPNNKRMRLKKIDVEVFANGKKVAEIDQKLTTVIPAHDNFSIALDVKLAMKELGFLDTLLGMIGGKKMEIQYKGSLKLTYHGLPIRVPVDYKDQIRVKF
jgi:LEA14-like dessication related protein